MFLVYINHRPAFGLDPHEIYRSFKILSKNKKQTISRSAFINEVQTIGIKIMFCMSEWKNIKLCLQENI